jgi:hypothetical protein
MLHHVRFVVAVFGHSTADDEEWASLARWTNVLGL